VTETGSQEPALAVALAETLDEQTLRQLFADAPADVAVPRDVGSLYRTRLRGMGGANRGPLLAAWCGLAVGGLVAGLAFQQSIGWVLVALALAIAVVLLVVARGQASDEFFNRYATARGLTHVEGGRVAANVPLFARGDKRAWPRVMEGTIAGQRATIAHYRYTDITRDSEGNRQQTHHDFTTVHLRLPDAVANRFVGVSLSPRSLSFGAIQDALAHDRKVELESVEFAKRYSLRVVDSQDDIALYELFSPPFVQLLATSLQVHWEQRGGDLVIWRRNHECEARDLDDMCFGAWHVVNRYFEEHR
jgi:hypothetical protein